MGAVEWTPESLLPHKGPMVLLDDVLEVSETLARAALRIGEDSPFYRPGLGVPVWAGTEYMAQAVGLTAGFRARKAGHDVTIGFLLGTRRFTAHVPAFRLGTRLTVSASEVWQDGQMAVFDCRIEHEKVLAEAQLNVFQPQDAAAFLKGKGL